MHCPRTDGSCRRAAAASSWHAKQILFFGIDGLTSVLALRWGDVANIAGRLHRRMYRRARRFFRMTRGAVSVFAQRSGMFYGIRASNG
jgi:hypothetical protein